MGEADPAEVLDLMGRVTLIPSHSQTLFGPKITIYLKNGNSVSKEGTGMEFAWDFQRETERLQEIIPGLPIPQAQFEKLIAACAEMDTLERADELIKLTQI
jgi:hypothetical protein